ILPTLDHEEPTLEADINFQVAEILSSKGDHDAAREKALRAQKLREEVFGQVSNETVQSHNQVANIALQSFRSYQGVCTPQIERAIRLAIICYEKLYKHYRAKKSSRKTERIIFDLTRRIITLKLQVITNNQHRDLVRSHQQEPRTYPEETSKDVFMRMVHVSPSSFLDDIFRRLDDGDSSAPEELGVMLSILDSSGEAESRDGEH
ncbi:hypothetical protein HDU93_003498, partial [Gonapodya sp. JEL0774]